jgi:hypothetical protein
MASTKPGRVAARVPADGPPKQLIQSVSALLCDHLGACVRDSSRTNTFVLREHTVPQGTANRQHESYANHVGLLVNILGALATNSPALRGLRLHYAGIYCK